MVIGRRGLDNEYLNPDLCYCAWVITGSIGKAIYLLESSGIINPRTGGRPSRMGVWFSARKSPMYAAFMNSGQVTVSQEEIDYCRKLFHELLPKEIERLNEIAKTVV